MTQAVSKAPRSGFSIGQAKMWSKLDTEWFMDSFLCKNCGQAVINLETRDHHRIVVDA